MIVPSRVDLKKPDLKSIQDGGFTPVDMHYHTRFSDTYTRVSKIVYNAEKKCLGVAITDHNAIGGSLLAWKLKDDILVIPGIETTSKEGPHILSYFPRTLDLKNFFDACVRDKLEDSPYLRTRSSVSDIIRWTHEYGGITSAAHPFCPGMMGLFKAIKRGYVKERAAEDIDAMEVLTGVNIKLMTRKSIKWAESLDKPITGGSDGHSLHELGKVVAYAKADTPKRFIERILEKQSFVMGKEMGLVGRVPSYTKTTNRHLRYIKPFITNKAKNIMKESVYYHTHNLKAIALKGAIAVNKKTHGLPGRIAKKGLKIASPLIHNGKKKKGGESSRY